MDNEFTVPQLSSVVSEKDFEPDWPVIEIAIPLECPTM
jgi:hypothetical protein